jgi:hypothetical protein
MAKITILNPNDQPTGKWRLINELRAGLASNDYHTLLIAVALAKTGPLLRLKAEIEQWLAKGKKIASIFGVNHRNTSRQALQFAYENFTTARVLFHSDDLTYHPKMYLFVGPQYASSRMIIDLAERYEKKDAKPATLFVTNQKQSKLVLQRAGSIPARFALSIFG